MNQRIKELAAQATRQYSPTYYTPEWIQGFAELIVQECAKVAIEQKAKAEPADEWEFGYDSGVHTARSAIKKHFGVE